MKLWECFDYIGIDGDLFVFSGPGEPEILSKGEQVSAEGMLLVCLLPLEK